MKMEMRDELACQLDHAFGMVREAIKYCPPAEWRTGETDWHIPARLVLHILEVFDYYINPHSTGWASPTVHWHSADEDLKPPEELPDQEWTIMETERVERRTRDFFDHGDDDLLNSPQKSCRRTGRSLAGRAMYLLRHAHQHLGEISAEYERRGFRRPTWQ